MEKQPTSSIAPAERSATPSESRSLPSSSRSSRGSSAFHVSMAAVAIASIATGAYLAPGLLQHKATTGDGWPFYIVLGGMFVIAIATAAPASLPAILSTAKSILPWGKKTDQ